MACRDMGCKACGVPVLPGFDEFAVPNARDGHAGDVHGRAGCSVDTIGGPMDTGEVVLG